MNTQKQYTFQQKEKQFSRKLLMWLQRIQSFFLYTLILAYLKLTEAQAVPEIVRNISVDCLQVQKSPPKFVTAYPQNEIYNCREYCIQFYGRQPQRAYYNVTSQMCEPLAFCKSGYHNYEDNSCYQQRVQKTAQEKAEFNTTKGLSLNNQLYNFHNKSVSVTYYPQTIITDSSSIDPFTEQRQIICLNGYQRYKSLQSLPTCICEKLWEDSNTYDLNGNIFKCDVVTSNFKPHFYEEMIYSQNSSMYGPYSEDDIRVVLENLKLKQQRQLNQIISKAQSSIFIALDMQLPNENLFFGKQWKSTSNQQPEDSLETGSVLIILGLISLNIIVASTYYEYQGKVGVNVSKIQLRERIQKEISLILKDRRKKEEMIVLREQYMQEELA